MISDTKQYANQNQYRYRLPKATSDAQIYLVPRTDRVKPTYPVQAGNAVTGQDTWDLGDIRTATDADILLPLETVENLTREAAIAKLKAVGIRLAPIRAPKGARELTEAEREILGRVPPGSPTTVEIIDEDRG